MFFLVFYGKLLAELGIRQSPLRKDSGQHSLHSVDITDIKRKFHFNVLTAEVLNILKMKLHSISVQI